MTDYEAIFAAATPFTLHVLHGTYYIRMLRRPSLHWFNHTKLFCHTPMRVYGTNFTAKRRWGYFTALQVTLDDGYATMLDYDRDDNGWTVRHLRDYVRSLGQGCYIGKLYWKGRKGERFLGYFLMCSEKEMVREWRDVFG